MKKVILTTLAIVLAVSTVLSITGFAMADNEPTPDEAVAVRMGLVIHTPATAKVGEPIRIQIVTRPGERPVPRAEVWAVNIDKNPNDMSLTADAASLTQCNAILLGTTNDRGYVDPAPRIWERGKYILVAIKPNYAPGFSWMKITSRVPLTLRAPDSGRINQSINMKVMNPDGAGVPRVAMFAIPLFNAADNAAGTGNYDQQLRDAEAYADILEDPEAEAELKADTDAYNRAMNMRRYFIGFTDRNGDFTHRFSQPGPYLLIAAKCGYVPDFHIIKITGSQLHLRVQDTAKVGERVPMLVTDSSGQGVGQVALFAIPLLNTTQDGTITGDYERWLKYAEAYADSLENPSLQPDSSIGPEAYDQIRRYFIGFTDRHGNFTYSFQQAGPYLLIAAKCGYTPDFHIIKITKLEREKATAELAPVRVEEANISFKIK